MYLSVISKKILTISSAYWKELAILHTSFVSVPIHLIDRAADRDREASREIYAAKDEENIFKDSCRI